MYKYLHRDSQKRFYFENTRGANSNSRLLKVDVEYYRKKFIKKYGFAQTEFPPFQWQKSFYDQYIRNQRDFDTHYNYTINNHIKHGLPKKWKNTSLSYSILIDG